MDRQTTRREGHGRGPTRAGLETLLTPSLAHECSERLWSEAWEWAGLTPGTLWLWCQQFGTDLAALAVAGRVTELQMRRHLADGRRPDRDVLEMLADLNCYPYVTPAARPVALDVGVGA